MATASEKLRALARQSRTLSGMVADRKRAEALIALASLYERQAREIEGAGAGDSLVDRAPLADHIANFAIVGR